MTSPGTVFSMPKALCIVGTVIAALLLLVFGIDLALKFPFGRQPWWMDLGFAVCAGILGYLSWTALREQV
jgi:hypothetical protein